MTLQGTTGRDDLEDTISRAYNGDFRSKPRARDLSTIWADDYQLNLDAGGVVDGLLPRTGKSVKYGDSGSGKTFNAIDLACHVACGLPWRGMAVEQGVVVYVAAEAPESVKRRLWAWKRHHGVDRLPVVVVRSSVDLLNGDADAVVALVETVTREHGRVALVVVDTLARAMTGNENTPDDMGRFIAACSRIGEAGDTHVMIVHHSGKDQARGARGHSSLRAATDVELEVTAGEGGCSIKVTKSRDDESGHSFGFRLETVELGENAKGRMVTTCVAVEGDAPEKSAKEVRLTDKQRNALACLATAIADHGTEPPLSPDIPHKVRVVSLERWFETARRYMPSEEQEDPKGQGKWRFQRIAEALRARGVIRYAGGFYWLPSQISQTSQKPVCENVRHPQSDLTNLTTLTSPYKGCEIVRCETASPAKVVEPAEEAETEAATDPHGFRLWHSHGVDISDAEQFLPVPVVKVTAKRVYVPREYWFKDHEPNGCIALDRAELEEKGRSSNKATRYDPIYTDAGRAAFKEKEAARKIAHAEAFARGRVKQDQDYRAFLGLPAGIPLTVSEVEERFAQKACLMDLNPDTLEDEYRTKFVLDASDEPAMKLLRVRSFLLQEAQP